MGYGDFKLMAALGARFGWQALPALVLLSSVVGLLFGLVRIALRRQHRDTPFPFGPFIAGAGLLVLFTGPARCRSRWACRARLTATRPLLGIHSTHRTSPC